MRAAQVVRLDGPSGVEVVSVDEPEEVSGEYLVDVHAVGVSFPDLLLSAGKYQLKPEVPFTLGVDFAGVVRSGPAGSDFQPGDRVAGWGYHGNAADVVSADADHLFPLPDAYSFVQGACLPMNYLTTHFALLTRGALAAGETVLVHGAAGGVGTASIQVAKAYGARVVAVVSSPAKAEVATAAGADHTVSYEDFGDQVREITDGRGVDIVLDVVGGSELAVNSLRALAPLGRFLVIGFTGGEIASVKVNRLLLRNVDVRGVGWGGYVALDPSFPRKQWQDLLPHLEPGALTPPVGTVYPFEDVRQALVEMAERRTLGKSVLTLR